jgi:3-methyl-2-oxobutanoate hydroxymethyltransferase
MSINNSLVQLKKDLSRKIVMLTAYDHPTAVLLAQAGVDVILVGDSLANVVLGLDATTGVGLDEMLHHAKAVCRGAGKVPVIADIPADVMASPDPAAAARKFIDAGCAGVKVEWSASCLAVVKCLREAGIEVMGHVGLTPQTATEFKVQGKDAASAKLIMDQAARMQDTGCFAMVLECVPEGLARDITLMLKIPTIGIGAGKFCDGQVLVLHDMIGLGERKAPKFVKKYADVSGVILQAVRSYKNDVQAGTFPGPEQSFH